MWRILIALLWTAPALLSTIFITTIYLHRGLTHGSLVVSRVLEPWLRLWIWVMTGIVPREWVAVHRKHHAHTDEPGDPHSPLDHGVWGVTFRNVKYYSQEAKDPETIATYAKDIKRDRLDYLFNHNLLGMATGLVLWCLIFGPVAGAIAYVTHGVTYVLLSGAINGLGHGPGYGYQNWRNTARNLRWLAWLTGGEGLHNNHHGAPRSPKLSHAAGEQDPAWPVIHWLASLHLITVHGKIVEHPAPRGVIMDRVV